MKKTVYDGVVNLRYSLTKSEGGKKPTLSERRGFRLRRLANEYGLEINCRLIDRLLVDMLEVIEHRNKIKQEIIERQKKLTGADI